MNELILALLFLALALGGIVVRKTYYYVPFYELKRRAERDEPLARRLYPAVAYDGSLQVLLWLYIGLMSAASIVLLARLLPIWASLLVVGPILWITFSWLPTSRVTKTGARVTLIVTPVVVWLLNYLHPILRRGSKVTKKYSGANLHTGLFERNDLIDLLEQQQRQVDSRINDQELEIARRALNFGEYKVRNILVPRKVVKTVLANDTVGPVLIDELHKNAQGYALVRDKPKGDFIGSLAFKKLGLKSSGQVKNIMDADITYVHENDSLSQVLHAFFATRQPLFVVVNSHEEYVGIITLDGILEQLLGKASVGSDDETFDEHHNMSAVAARHPKAKAKKASVKKDEKVVK